MSSIVLNAANALIIAHRGASALRPEHTLEAYAKAIEDGADFIEPDLVMTRDGVLVARHEIELSRSTDVATRPQFDARRTRKHIDGEQVEGWFCNDFSLTELRLLRAREPMPELRSREHDGLYPIPTFDEIVELAAGESARRGKQIGIIPELKNSSWFHAVGLDPEQAILDALQRHAYLREAPFGIQSFEVSNLKSLRERMGSHSNVFLVQLVGDSSQQPFDRFAAGDSELTYAAMLTPSGLRAISRYADVVAVNIRSVLPWDTEDEVLDQPTEWIEAAHSVGLRVHAWTLRPENHFLPVVLQCGDDHTARCEIGSITLMRQLIDAGVDGLFTDDPALGRCAVDAIDPL